ncbi:proteasome adapter and scaffold protein ECM29-like [Anthonomus grandis grandis]|uniref:proteasome adapter and scaffold protein ECM29-like n=1 Tax=Anthonomus grandis grandis TaxID=2921223 RepID=UPI002166279A|nr:proteasome adapter and scaffold protein ECM29-like [Anthonomus grandis grandis]
MAADDLMLLERVFLRLGSAETDDQLENVLGKFLVPVLLKLSSAHESVRKKVMELLIHVNKRIKTRPNIQLPVEALINQYTDPAASSFVNNFTIIYIKSGFPRLSTDKQAELVPLIINALKGKPKLHLDSLLMLIVPLLGKVKVPTEPEKKKSLFDLDKNPDVAKYFLDILLDVLLLPYSSLSLQCQDNDLNGSSISAPPGMSQMSLKRIVTNNTIKLEEFETIKLGIVKFLSQDVFKPEEILLHFIVAAADTRFEVANLADMELKKVLGFIDWTSPQSSQPIFILFLGSKSPKADQVKMPASTRIRLKLLTYLSRFQGEACLFPYSLQVVFDSLYGENTNSKLKNLALSFTANLIRYSKGDSLKKVSPVLLVGLTKLIKGDENEHQGQAYMTISMLAQKFPHIVFSDVGILELYFNNLEVANPNLKIQVREGLLNLLVAYKYDIYPEEADKDGRLGILLALLKVKMNSQEPMVRFACVRTLSTIFPVDHVPSKFLLLVAIGDREEDVRQEAFKSIYGMTRKTNFGEASEIDKSLLPSFSDITKLVYNETEKNMADKSKSVNVGSSTLPFSVNVYLEIILYLRLCLLRNLDIPLTRDVLKHPCEYTPKVAKQILDIYNDPSGKEMLNHYASLVRSLLLTNSGLEPILCMTELIGSVPDLHNLMVTDMDWITNQLNNVKEEIRENVAILYSLVLTLMSDGDDFDKSVKYLIEQCGKNNLEAQHGALLGLANSLEAYALKKMRENAIFDKIKLTKECINTIVPFMKNQNPLLVAGSCTGIGLIGRVISLPLEDGKIPEDGSPNPKKPAVEMNKLQVVERLMDVMKNNKLSAKVREKAARSLGLLCVGEKFVHAKLIIQGLLNTATEVSTLEIYFYSYICRKKVYL